MPAGAIAILAFVGFSDRLLAVFGYFFISSTIGALVNEILRTEWGSVLIVAKLMRFLWSDFFGIRQLRYALPAPVSIAATCLVLLAMLLRRVRAFEVVRGVTRSGARRRRWSCRWPARYGVRTSGSMKIGSPERLSISIE